MVRSRGWLTMVAALVALGVAGCSAPVDAPPPTTAPHPVTTAATPTRPTSAVPHAGTGTARIDAGWVTAIAPAQTQRWRIDNSFADGHDVGQVAFAGLPGDGVVRVEHDPEVTSREAAASRLEGRAAAARPLGEETHGGTTYRVYHVVDGRFDVRVYVGYDETTGLVLEHRFEVDRTGDLVAPDAVARILDSLTLARPSR
ncbi:MAG TPA: hypothetical protein GXZ45_12640 [Propionibacterium sp.]|nr:hypothetical protein [Propionibacterium sp.]